MSRIRVTLRCVADHYAAKDRERIIEFFDPETGKGGLIGFFRREDGSLLVQPYRLDDGVLVSGGTTDFR
jgi:hypothetical protein